MHYNAFGLFFTAAAATIAAATATATVAAVAPAVAVAYAVACCFRVIVAAAFVWLWLLLLLLLLLLPARGANPCLGLCRDRVTVVSTLNTPVETLLNKQTVATAASGGNSSAVS